MARFEGGRERRGGGRFGERHEYGGGGGRSGGFGGGGGGGFGGGGGGAFREAPVHPGEEYDVTITDVAAKGDGIAKIQGFIVFVPGTKSGETCRIKIRDVRNRFATADKVGAAESLAESEVPAGRAEEKPSESEATDEEATGEDEEAEEEGEGEAK